MLFSNAALSNMTRTTCLSCIYHLHVCHTLCPAPPVRRGHILLLSVFSVGLPGKQCSLNAYGVRSRPTEAFPGQGSQASAGVWEEWGPPPLVPFLGAGGRTCWASHPSLSTEQPPLSSFLVSPQRLFTLCPLPGLISHAAGSWRCLLR